MSDLTALLERLDDCAARTDLLRTNLIRSRAEVTFLDTEAAHRAYRDLALRHRAAEAVAFDALMEVMASSPEAHAVANATDWSWAELVIVLRPVLGGMLTPAQVEVYARLIRDCPDVDQVGALLVAARVLA